MIQVAGYTHESRIGPFLIRSDGPEGWSLWHDHECLGRRYGNAQQALDDLCGGHCDWPGTTDPSTLGLPDEVGDWTPLAPQRR